MWDFWLGCGGWTVEDGCLVLSCLEEEKVSEMEMKLKMEKEEILGKKKKKKSD